MSTNTSTTQSIYITTTTTTVPCEGRANFSFIYVFLPFLALSFMCVGLYAYKVISHFCEQRPFSTISEHCAHPASNGHRYLVAVTCIVGVCLVGIQSEEFISISITKNVVPNGFFIADIIAAAMIPLIGIFHTEGYDHPPKMTKQTNLYGCKGRCCPIWMSTSIHYVAAGMLLLWNPISCTIYILQCLKKTDPHFILLAILLVLSWLLLLLFVIFQAIIRLAKKFKRKPFYCIYVASYVLEALTITLIIVMTSVFSIHQNSIVKFFGSNYCPDTSCNW